MDKKDFDKLTDKEKIDTLWCIVEDLEDKVFQYQQIIDHQRKIDKYLTPEQILQRKAVWSKKEVCEYFGFTSKSFERYKDTGEIKVKSIAGKDYCRLIDLKDRFMDRGDDIDWLVKHMP